MTSPASPSTSPASTSSSSSSTSTSSASASTSPATVGPYQYFPVEFDKDGNAAKPEQFAAVMNAIAVAPPGSPNTLTDLFVISHGWNDNIAEAEDLYTKIFTCFGDVLKADNPECDDVRARRAAVLGILWPSKKFEDASLTAGGSAALPDPAASATAVLDVLSSFLDTPDATQALARAKTLVPQLAGSLDARDEFVRIVRAFMPHDSNDEEPAIPNDLFTLNGDELLQRLSRPTPGVPSGNTGGAASFGGGAAGFGDWFGSAVEGAKSLANLVMYYQMKNRAGAIGQSGVYDMLRRIRTDRPADGPNSLRLHLMGHSFGCRLITAATAGPTANTPPLPVDTMSLLQAAFSHYAFAQAYDGSHDGFYRRVVTGPTRVRGPLLITFTAKDKAVGIAYPIASRIARQIAAALGDANDPYGGLGRNGAQKTPASVTVKMGDAGSAYTFAPRGVYNLDANLIINAHSDVAHDEVAWAVVSAIASPWTS